MRQGITVSAKTGKVSFHDVTELGPAEILAAERARMTCTPAQMRLALHRMGLLATVQGIADADPEASIVWEYATQIVRNSPLIEALSGDFTGSDIDEIFRAAMAVEGY